MTIKLKLKCEEKELTYNIKDVVGDKLNLWLYFKDGGVACYSTEHLDYFIIKKD